MPSAKETVRKILDLLPEDASFEQIQYHILVRRKIAAGLQAVEQGRVLTQQEAERRMERWLGS